MTTAIDSIGGEDGTYEGPWCADYGLVPGTNLSAKAEDAGTSYVLLPDAAFPCVPAHDWSISAIVNTGLGAPAIAYFAWDPSASEYIYLVVGDFSGTYKIILQFPDSSVGFPFIGQAIGTTAITAGTTHLFVATFDLSTNTFSVYMDGTLEASVVNPDHDYASATTPVFAAFGATDAVIGSAEATLDEFALYDVCLSAGDVTALEAARSTFLTFRATVKGLGATNLYHLGEAPLCPGVVVSSGWHVGRIGMAQ